MGVKPGTEVSSPTELVSGVQTVALTRFPSYCHFYVLLYLGAKDVNQSWQETHPVMCPPGQTSLPTEATLW